MWPLIKKHQIITLAIQPTHITCTAIALQTRPLYRVLDQIVIQEPHITLQGTLFNPTYLRQHIAKFIRRQKNQVTYLACSITGSCVFEEIIHMKTVRSNPLESPSPMVTKKIWDHCYLYPTDTGHVLYRAGIHQEILMQYRLLAQHIPSRLLVVTTNFTALLHVYRHMYGNAFRHTQLGKDLVHHNHNLEKIITPDILARLITYEHTNDQHKIAVALGLFLAGTKTYENG